MATIFNCIAESESDLLVDPYLNSLGGPPGRGCGVPPSGGQPEAGGDRREIRRRRVLQPARRHGLYVQLFLQYEDSDSWTVEYGKTTKSITDPKGTTIRSVKEEIERSRAFLDGLKKAKDKNWDGNAASVQRQAVRPTTGTDTRKKR